MTNETRPFNIILAEDNPADVSLVREALQTHGIDCTLNVVSDGEKALKLLDALDCDSTTPPVDLLILDMHLPKHDGEDILKRLRSTENYAQTPVIVMTAIDSDKNKAHAARHAASFYFAKPSTLDELMKLGSLVRMVLRQGHQGGQTPANNDRTAGG